MNVCDPYKQPDNVFDKPEPDWNDSRFRSKKRNPQQFNFTNRNPRTKNPKSPDDWLFWSKNNPNQPTNRTDNNPNNPNQPTLHNDPNNPIGPQPAPQPSPSPNPSPQPAPQPIGGPNPMQGFNLANITPPWTSTDITNALNNLQRIWFTGVGGPPNGGFPTGFGPGGPPSPGPGGGGLSKERPVY